MQNEPFLMAKQLKQSFKVNPTPGKEQAKKMLDTITKSPGKWALTGFLFIISFLLNVNTFNHRFVLDDHGIIKDNQITRAPLSWKNTKLIFSSPLRKGAGGDLDNTLYRPATKLLFNIEWNLFNYNPGAFHVITVLLYAILIALIFLVLYDAFKRQWVLPFFITLLFAVHPLHVEIVANIKSSDDILGLLGVFIALRCIQLHIHTEKIFYIPLGMLGYLLGLYSKESIVTLVAIFPLFIYFFYSIPLRKNIIISGLLMICALIFLYSRWATLHDLRQLPLYPMDNLLVMCPTSASRIATAVVLLAYYIKLFFVPFPLSCDYSFSTFKPVSMSSPEFFISFLLIISLLIYAIIKFKKKSIVSFGIMWFFITISIVSNIFFLIGTSMGDRLMFTPSLGLCIALVAFLSNVLNKANVREGSISYVMTKTGLLSVAILLICAIFAFKSFNRNIDWRSDYTLFKKDVENFPNAVHLLGYMGTHLTGGEFINEEAANEQEVAQGRLDAISYLQRAQSIMPSMTPEAFASLGYAYGMNKQFDSATKYIRVAYHADTTNPKFVSYMGSTFFNEGKYQEALPYCLKAFRIDSTNFDYMNNIGAIYGNLGNQKEAIQWFERGFKADSLNLVSVNFLAIGYNLLGDSVKANMYKNKLPKINQVLQERRENAAH